MQWPTDVLARILHFLAVSGYGICARQQLAFLVCKNKDLAKAARAATMPLVAEIEFPENVPQPQRVFLIPFMQATIVKIEIDWGDGSELERVEDGGKGFVKHSYQLPGRYTVAVFPTLAGTVCLDHLGFDDTNLFGIKRDPWWTHLISLHTLGTLGITSLSCLFSSANCNIDLSKLQVGGVRDLSWMFTNNEKFNQPISSWDVSSVTDMSWMFRGARKFNQDISSWNVSNVTSMAAMFFEALSFNQPIGSWNVGKVRNMSAMFRNALSFNHPIGPGDVSSGKDMKGRGRRRVLRPPP
eukprot:TRINITY_DN2209_c0_g2_i1.p1 TRINITY_DN2209_c0_g2~~TRINITY_DN2209_c0_g2_i1.p1  ORF type:complete len:297 (+),score=20.02 TRINITY_DN2209_c0_g2_i1:224-1114(+)